MVNRGYVIPAGDIFRFLKDFWESYNIQAIVLASLAFQIVLIFAAPSRKRTKSNSCVLTLWTIYLLADYLATFAIGLINNGSSIGTNGNDNNSGGYESCGYFKRSTIAAFWAPFLLLHLGGPDTITAFAVEDNELWLRHLLSLLVQVLSVLLVFYRYRILQYEFRIPTALAFIAGIIKYAERTRSLNLASLANLKKSMRKDPDPGPDYAQLMEEMASKQAASVPVKIDINREKGAKDDMEEDGTKNNKERMNELEVIQHGYKFFQIFKGLIVDHMFSFLERDDSRKFYLSLNYEEAFRVMEMELNFIYDAMFTKMSAVRGGFGYAFRFICTALLIAATVLFALHSHHNIHSGDIIVTYFLLAGGVALDLIAIVELIFSKWTVAVLLGDSDMSLGGTRNWKNRAANMISRVKGLIQTKRWSEEMHQYSLINHCLKNQNWPKWVYNIIEVFGLTETIDSCLYGKTQEVEDKLKKLIFEEIKKKGKQAKKTSVAKEISSSKGEWTLLDYNCGPEIHFTVSQEVDYDQCVLMWHIATEIFYFTSSEQKNNPPEPDICRYISEYLLYLLVMERKMTSGVAGIVENRFRDTCQEAMNFFNRGQQKQNTHRCFSSWCSLPTFEKAKEACWLYFLSMVKSTWKDVKYVFTLGCCFTTKPRKREPTDWEKRQDELEEDKRREACKRLTLVKPQVKPAEVKGDRSKSLLFDACILADNLKQLCHSQNSTYAEKEVWEMMSKVWVELLSYGACHCRGDAHAQYLSKGGELLTFVWLLMAHFGLGDQFRIEAGHARAKLIVGKEMNQNDSHSFH